MTVRSPYALSSLFLLSTSALAFEISLTRLFSVAQYYHFAFMIVSLALLGYGASGTFLAVFPVARGKNVVDTLGWLSAGQAAAILGAYLFVNGYPFDSFSIAWDAKQAVLLTGQFLALALPFFFNGLGVGVLLEASPSGAGNTYAANLLGSALGCLLALIAPSRLGVEGMITLCSGLAAFSALICFIRIQKAEPQTGAKKGFLPALAGTTVSMLLLGLACLDLGLRSTGRNSFSWLELNISPYKGLSYALQYPGAEIIFRKWNAFSRVDVVRSAGIRSLPGLSYRCLGQIPTQDGLLVDGDELTPILRSEENLDLYTCLPGAVAFQLRPQADVLLIEPRGGLDILAALHLGAWRVTAVEANPLIAEAAGSVYSLPDVLTISETERSFLRRTQEKFDIIQYALTASYHPVRSGTYSLAEDYRYTVESFMDALEQLKPGGILVVTRWLQNPPSEDLKTFALAVTALEKTGGDPALQIIALRGYNTVTILVKEQPFTEQEMEIIQPFIAERAFDLIYALGLKEEESNIYNILPEPVYYRAFHDLVNTQPRRPFYKTYPYEVSPPTDDRPFFGHFFKWSQIKQVMAELGKTMQPFGGAGYLVVVGLLGLAVVLAGAIIVMPLVLARGGRLKSSLQGEQPQKTGRLQSSLQLSTLIYFGMLGLAYLLVEIPLMQRFILFLGQPAYAMMCVLFTLLFFSALGSQVSGRVPLKFTLAVLSLLLVFVPSLLPLLFTATLAFPLAVRLVVTILALAPLGFLMGMPFPGGIGWLIRRGDEGLIPWAWGINGAASVVAAVLAALLSISFGFSWVFRLGALCYGTALLTVLADAHRRFPRPHL